MPLQQQKGWDLGDDGVHGSWRDSWTAKLGGLERMEKTAATAEK